MDESCFIAHVACAEGGSWNIEKRNILLSCLSWSQARYFTTWRSSCAPARSKSARTIALKSDVKSGHLPQMRSNHVKPQVSTQQHRSKKYWVYFFRNFSRLRQYKTSSEGESDYDLSQTYAADWDLVRCLHLCANRSREKSDPNIRATMQRISW